MSRKRMGAHGTVCERMNGTWQMTIRPDPFVFTDEDIAMLLGKAMEVLEMSPYGYDSVAQTFAQGMAGIFAWEQSEGRLTQKKGVELITNLAFYGGLCAYEMGDDSHSYYDDEIGAHRALLMKVRAVWPNFKVGVNRPSLDEEE